MQTTATPTKPAKEEVSSHILKFMIGVIAISLATITSLFTKVELWSISESYWAGGPARSIFLGFLFAIAVLLFAYNGKSTKEMIMSKIAGLAAICVAMFPCDCECASKRPELAPCEIVPSMHFSAAAVMFIILVYFCYTFYARARKAKPGHTKVFAEAKLRSFIYAACGLTIIAVIIAVLFDYFTNGSIIARFNTFIFYAEATALIAFGIAWLVASRTIPLLTAEPERYSLNPYVLQEEK